MKLYSMVIHKLFCVSLHCRLHSLDTQGQVVRKVDNAIHRINLYPVDNIILVSFLILIHWVVIYLVDSAIQGLNNQGQGCAVTNVSCTF